MSHRVQAVAGVRGLTLPGGWALNGGDTVVVSDDEWAQIRSDVETLGRLVDLGSTTDLPDPVPTWRDIQRTTAAGPTGLEAEVDALSAAFGAHEAATTGVHGIDDTSLLETQAGAQSKADAAAAAALSTAEAYTDTQVATLPGQYNQTFGFASAASVWTIVHGQGTRYLSVECFNSSGDRMLGEIEYVDDNTITVTWYYPTSGYARVFS